MTMYYYCLWYDKLWGPSQRVVTLFFSLFLDYLPQRKSGCYCQERKRRLTLLSSIYRGNGLLRPVMVSSTQPQLWSSSPVLTINFVCWSRYNLARSGFLLVDFLKSSCNRFFILVLKIRRNSQKAPCISNLLLASHITLAIWSLIDTTFCFILCTKYNMPAILGCQDSPIYKARAFQKSWSR